MELLQSISTVTALESGRRCRFAPTFFADAPRLFFIHRRLKISNVIKAENRRNRTRKYKNVRYAFFHSKAGRTFPLISKKVALLFNCAQRNLLLPCKNVVIMVTCYTFGETGVGVVCSSVARLMSVYSSIWTPKTSKPLV